MGAIPSISLSASAITRRVEDLGKNCFPNLKKKRVVKSLSTFSLALDESNDVADTEQPLIFAQGINENFEITEELAAPLNREIELFICEKSKPLSNLSDSS